MYLASERKEHILKVLSDRGSARTVILSKEMDVTDETVRNDLIELEKSGLLKRVHGGAISLKKKVMNESIMTNVSIDVNIAKAAADHIKSGRTIFIDGGALGNMTAAHLPPLPVTVVTNSPDVINRLEGNSNVEIYCTGGLLDRKTGLLIGIDAAQSVSKLSIDTLMLIPDAYCPQRGLGYSSMAHAEFTQELVNLGREVIVLCPSSRLGSSATYYPLAASKITRVITNDDAPEDMLQAIIESGVTLQKV